MPSLSKLYKSAKSKLNLNRNKNNGKENVRRESNSKSVRFSTLGESIYYTHSSLEYDRRSISINGSEGDYLRQSIEENEDDTIAFDEEVIRNTKVNKKQGHHSIAALVIYRSNF